MNRPHRRWNPLTGEWLLVSPQRTERPWQGQVEKPAAPPSVQYDPGCYLCPGNERANGSRNPRYASTYVFTNDFAALVPNRKAVRCDSEGRGLMVAQSEAGTCRVICFSPRHDLTLPRMQVGEIAAVVNVWAEQYAELGASGDVGYVQIFENKGEIMGCSNPHPHGQIWASEHIPNEPWKEQQSQLAYFREHRSCMLCDYLAAEREQRQRVVCENDHFAAVVPFWAVWPFETMLISKAHAGDLVALNVEQRTALADILKRLTTRYDNLFQISFPYSMGIHQPPTDNKAHPEWHLHLHFYPPLLRSATIRKFLVGYEMMAEPQRDITPEVVAERLQSLSDIHYADRS